MANHPEEEDFGALLAEYDQERADPEVGETVKGTILSIGEEVAFVDLGTKSEGTIDRTELVDDEGRPTVAVGDEIEALVSAVDPGGSIVLTVRPGRTGAQVAELRLAWEQKLPVEGVVGASTKGGVEVTVAGYRAFCPISQLSDRYLESADELTGQKLDFLIQRFEEQGPRLRLVVSRRALLQAEAERKAAELRGRLAPGVELDGVVSSVTHYGAFVDLGGLEGLLHVSEMSHQRIADPREHLSEGQKVRVQVVRIEASDKPGQTERIALSTKALETDPWHDVATRFPQGTAVDGHVMRLEPFGAFIELVPGIEGLIHISQLGGEEHLRHARQVLELGQPLRVKVLSVDPERRRISLALDTSQKETEAAAELDAYRRSAPKTQGFGSLGDFFKKADKS